MKVLPTLAPDCDPNAFAVKKVGLNRLPSKLCDVNVIVYCIQIYRLA